MAAARIVTRRVQTQTLAAVFAALAHPQRLSILLLLLGGEAAHQTLVHKTGLKAGPLYHHIRELRAAGLIGPKVRDLYTLTRRGEVMLLGAVTMMRLARQRPAVRRA